MTFDLTPEQIRRAQINGGAARILPTTKNYNGFGVRADHSEKILKLLKGGERSIAEVSQCLNVRYETAQKHLLRLVDAGKVEPRPHKGRKGKFFRLATAVERNRNVTPLPYRKQLMREILAKNERERVRR